MISLIIACDRSIAPDDTPRTSASLWRRSTTVVRSTSISRRKPKTSARTTEASAFNVSLSSSRTLSCCIRFLLTMISRHFSSMAELNTALSRPMDLWTRARKSGNSMSSGHPSCRRFTKTLCSSPQPTDPASSSREGSGSSCLERLSKRICFLRSEFIFKVSSAPSLASEWRISMLSCCFCPSAWPLDGSLRRRLPAPARQPTPPSKHTESESCLKSLDECAKPQRLASGCDVRAPILGDRDLVPLPVKSGCLAEVGPESCK